MITFSYPAYVLVDDAYHCLGYSSNLQQLLRVEEQQELLNCVEKTFLPLYQKIRKAYGDEPQFHRVKLGEEGKTWEVLVFAGTAELTDHRKPRTLVVMDGAHFEDLKRQIWDANLAETISSLAPGFLHTLRNPLNSIAITLYVLRETLTPEMRDRVSRYLDMLENDLRRQDENLTQVFSFLLREPMAGSDEVDLYDLLPRLPKLLRHEVMLKGLQLDIQAEQKPMWIELSPIRLTQIIVNLLADLSLFSRRIYICANTQGDRIVLEVSTDPCDNASEDLEKATYHREAKRHHMVLAQDIAESAGAEFKIETETGLRVRCSFAKAVGPIAVLA